VSVARLGTAAAVLAVVALYAVLSSRWTARSSRWYAELPRPSWQPPDLVFGVVWPLNFGAIAVAGLTVTLEAPGADGIRWLLVLAASVALALGWAHAFYGPHDLGRAAVLLAGATVLTWGLVVITVGLVLWAGWLLVPYAVWLSVATSLAVGYWRLVPREGPVTS
jgi:benzodiazapine receptor